MRTLTRRWVSRWQAFWARVSCCTSRNRRLSSSSTCHRGGDTDGRVSPRPAGRCVEWGGGQVQVGVRGETGCQDPGEAGVTLGQVQVRGGGRCYVDHGPLHGVGGLMPKHWHSPASGWNTHVCSHFQNTPTHVQSHTRSCPRAHTHVPTPDPCTHLELVADLMLLDGGRFLSPGTEVPGGEHFDTDRRLVVLAEEQPLGQPLHHPGGSRRQGPMGEGPRSGVGSPGQPRVQPGVRGGDMGPVSLSSAPGDTIGAVKPPMSRPERGQGPPAKPREG